MASTASSQHRCVFVGNIPYDATEEQLIQICEEVGPVVSFRLVLDKETGKPKGYGFCEYKDEETALSARRNLQGYEINGRQLRVDFAENDKGADRNKEQGRGGPGLTSDGQKSLPGHPFVGDAALHQPLGLPLAATAASVMAEALGGSQTCSLPQFRSVPPSVSGSGNDPLTLYLAKMSRHQLNEIMLEMKGLATKNKALAQQLLRESPQLPKALFQAQIMLGIMTPQMMQAASNQKTSKAIGESSVQDIQQDLKRLLPFNLGLIPSQKDGIVGSFLRPPEAHANNVLPSSLVLQQSSLPPRHVPFQVHQPPFLQNQIPAQGIAGITMHSNVQVPHLPTSRGSLPQMQPSVMHHSRPLGNTNIGQQPQMTPLNTNLQQALLPRSITSQFASSNPPVVLNGLEMLSREAKLSGSSLDSTWTLRGSTQASSNVGLVKQNEAGSEAMVLSNHLSKRPKLEEGGITHNLNRGSSSAVGLSLAQSSDSGLLAGRYSVGLQSTEKQITQLSPEEESALLQQLMSLTPEQLSSLPLEQQQQVLEIQRSLRLKIA